MEYPPTALVLLAAALGVVAAAMLFLRVGRRATGRKVRVVGVGGGGTNAVEAMLKSRLGGVDYVVINTDARALRRSSAATTVAIGRPITNGLGAGGDAAAGEVAARDATDEISRALAGSDFVVITAGLGGGTGSGAASVVADIARQHGALTLAVVTLPCSCEGARRHQLAAQASTALASKVDAVATIPNDSVRETMPAGVTVDDAFRSIDERLCRSVGEILDLVAASGRLDLDFADVRAVLQDGGAATVAFGRATGENRAVEATRTAMAAAFPARATARPASILVNVAGSSKVKLSELDAVSEAVLAAAPGANLIFGMSVRPRLRDEVQVTVIATGLDRATDAGVASVDATPPVWRPVWLRRGEDAPAATRLAPRQAPRRGKGATGRAGPGVAGTADAPETDPG